MASWKPELYNPEKVAAYYEDSDAVTFRIYIGTKPDPAYLRYQFDQDDQAHKAEGATILRASLQAILDATENTNPYLLEIVHQPKGRGKKAVTTNIVFQLNRVAAFGSLQQNNNQPAVSSELVQVLRGIIEQNNLIISKLNGEDTVEDEPGSFSGQQKSPLIGMLERPEIQNVLAGALGEFLKKVLKLDAVPAHDNLMLTNLAGMDENEKKISQAIEILKKHDKDLGESLMKLAALAESNPAYFTQLITMVKQM